jgi:ribosome-binding ATPase YchF (GTP1/OBG family)
MLTEQLTGLGIKEEHITGAIRKINLETAKPSQWKDEQIFKLTDYVRAISKPIIIAFNKCDKAPESLMEKRKELTKYNVIPCSAESELALNNAAEKGIIAYTPGSNDFTLLKKEELTVTQLKALEYIKTHVLLKYGATGVQRCIDEAVRMLDLIVVYPVEDEHHLTDKEGRVLPDAHLIPRGSTAKDLAYKVHTDLGDHFIRGIDARTHRVIGADHLLQDGDIISIIADA